MTTNDRAATGTAPANNNTHGPGPTLADVDANIRKHIADIATMLPEKNRLYRSSFLHSGDILRTLFPDGIPPNRLDDVTLILRIIDKLRRLGNAPTADQESPYRDIAGYGILGMVLHDLASLGQSRVDAEWAGRCYPTCVAPGRRDEGEVLNELNREKLRCSLGSKPRPISDYPGTPFPVGDSPCSTNTAKPAVSSSVDSLFDYLCDMGLISKQQRASLAAQKAALQAKTPSPTLTKDSTAKAKRASALPPKSLVYISYPYSQGGTLDNGKIYMNAQSVQGIGQKVMEMGHVPVCVQTMYYAWNEGYEMVMECALELLTVCDVVLALGDSPGVRREVERASRLGIPIAHSLDDLVKGRLT